MKKINYNGYKKPTDYMKFEAGDTKMKIISSGIIGMHHAIRARNYVPLGMCMAYKGECEHCDKGNEPKRVWRWIVVDVEADEVKMLEAGPMLGNEICELADREGDPQEYDIIVHRTGELLKTKYTAKKADTVTEESKGWVPTKRYLIKKYFG